MISLGFRCTGKTITLDASYQNIHLDNWTEIPWSLFSSWSDQKWRGSVSFWNTFAFIYFVHQRALVVWFLFFKTCNMICLESTTNNKKEKNKSNQNGLWSVKLHPRSLTCNLYLEPSVKVSRLQQRTQEQRLTRVGCHLRLSQPTRWLRGRLRLFSSFEIPCKMDW